jgi:hypothetical protein
LILQGSKKEKAKKAAIGATMGCAVAGGLSDAQVYSTIWFHGEDTFDCEPANLLWHTTDKTSTTLRLPFLSWAIYMGLETWVSER